MSHLIEVRTHNAWVHASIAEVKYPYNLCCPSEQIETVRAINAGSPVNGDHFQTMIDDIHALCNIDVVGDQLVTLSYPKCNPWMVVEYAPVYGLLSDKKERMFLANKTEFANIDFLDLNKTQHSFQLENIANAAQYIAVKVNLQTKRFSLMTNHKQIDEDKGKVDRVTIPTVEAGFAYGVTTDGLTNYLQHPSIQSFSLLKNNCADHVSRVLDFSQTQAKHFKITAELQQAEKATHSLFGVANPNMRLPWGKTIKSYAKIIRQHVLQASIEDAGRLLTITQKIQQVIKIEILRLQDGVHNINNSCIAPLRQQSLKMKQAKLKELRQYAKAIEGESDEAVKISQLAELCNNPDINAGKTRHKTADHLRQLLAAVQSQQEHEQAPQGITI
ncbi:MAG: hypothetical protein P1U63_11110 [Coxiellaceae bacterium]|nr:hypothetical protein [Coxiellaceae bacterium]